jgi:hypothetical protein
MDTIRIVVFFPSFMLPLALALSWNVYEKKKQAVVSKTV